MGRLICTGYQLLGSISEIIGHKSGLALSEDQIREFLSKDGDDGDFLPVNLADMMAIRAEEIEDAIRWLLYCVGSIDDPSPMPPMFRVTFKYKDNKKLFKKATDISQIFVSFLNSSLKISQPYGSKIDPTPFLLEASRKHGKFGLQVGIQFIDSLNLDLYTNPWSKMRIVEWKDITELNNLFKNEGLKTNHGEYFDQRFVNYLHRNFDHIDHAFFRIPTRNISFEIFRVESGLTASKR